MFDNIKIRIKNSVSGTVRVFQILSIIMFMLFIIFSAISIGTSYSGINYLTKKYVSSSVIGTTYFDNYKELGFNDAQCYELLNSDTIKSAIANVMCDRFSALLNNTTEYKYSYDTCFKDIKTHIINYINSHNISLSDDEINSISKYTFEITGLSVMFSYETPEEYRYEKLEVDTAEANVYNDMFRLLATFSSPVFPVCLFAMYFICILVTIFSCEPNKRHLLYQVISDTTFIPCILILGIAVGGILGPTNEIINEYIFNILLLVGICGLILGLIFLTILLHVFRLKDTKLPD